MMTRARLITMAGAAFVYVTAETLPIGLVPQLSAGLHVRPGTVGLLVFGYAALAGLTAGRGGRGPGRPAGYAGGAPGVPRGDRAGWRIG